MSARALVFTDLVDSTRTVARLGDARAAEVWAEHDRRARDLLALHNGREIGRADGFFLLFDDPSNAARYALTIVREVASRRDEGVVLGCLGALHSNQGRTEEALAHYEAALAVHREVGNRRFEGEVLGNMGELLARSGRAGDARAALQSGEILLREIGDRLDLARLLCLRGQAEVKFGDTDAARSALIEAETLAGELQVQSDSELFPRNHSTPGRARSRSSAKQRRQQ